MTDLNKTLEQRGDSYGSFREMAMAAQTMKEVAINVGTMTAVQVEAMEMICTKIARLATGNPNHYDSWLDIAGYAQLVCREMEESELTTTA